MNGEYAVITLHLFRHGIYAECDDVNDGTFIKAGDGQGIVDFVNQVDSICHPDTTFTITDKGREMLKEFMSHDKN